MNTRQFIKTCAVAATGLYVPNTYAQDVIAVRRRRVASAPNGLLNSLKAYYKFDSPGYYDDSYGSNALTASGSPLNSAAFGVINGHVNCNASTQLRHAHNSDFDLGTGISFTCSIWLNPNSWSGTYRPVIGQYDGFNNDYSWILLGTSGQLDFVGYPTNTSNQQRIHIANPLTTSVWSHVVVGYDSGAGQLFTQLNNGARSTVSIVGDLNASIHDFIIGYAYVLGGEFYDGRVDECAFWKRVLSTTDVASLYNSGSGLPLSSFTL